MYPHPNLVPPPSPSRDPTAAAVGFQVTCTTQVRLQNMESTGKQSRIWHLCSLQDVIISLVQFFELCHVPHCAISATTPNKSWLTKARNFWLKPTLSLMSRRFPVKWARSEEVTLAQLLVGFCIGVQNRNQSLKQLFSSYMCIYVCSQYIYALYIENAHATPPHLEVF